MSDFGSDEWGQSEDFFDTNGQPSRKKTHKKQKATAAGSWHAAMTILPLVTVGAVSFAMAYLTASVESRPAWLLALTFAAPVFVLMTTVLLLEKATNAMTPSVSRKAQTAFAAGTIALSLIVGFFCQVTNVEANATQGWSNAIIILDKSSSMTAELGEDTDKDKAATDAVLHLLEQMDPSVQIGLVVDRGSFGSTSIDIAPLSANRTALEAKIKKKADGGTNFSNAMEKAANMIGHLSDKDAAGLQIMMVTDGEDMINVRPYIQLFQNKGIIFHYIRLGAQANPELEKLVAETGGLSLDVKDGQQLQDTMESITITTYDALRDIDQSNQAKMVVGILMAILGILIGVSLTVMFSVQGQRRFQIILSPLMAILAFVILAFGKDLIPDAANREGLAFTLLGLVFMKKNKEKQPEIAQPDGSSIMEDMW